MPSVGVSVSEALPPVDVTDNRICLTPGALLMEVSLARLGARESVEHG
jgi:hypothetical protein